MSETIEFLEAFALGDRDAALASLTAGTLEHFQFGSLLSEQRGYPDALEASLRPFAKAHPREGLLSQFQRRQMLTCFDPAGGAEAPANAAALDMITSTLGLSYRHQQRLPRHEQGVDLTPSVLAPTVLDLDRLVQTALSRGTSFTGSVRPHSVARDLPQVLDALPGNVPLIHAYFHNYGAPDMGDDFAVAQLVASCIMDYNKGHDRSIDSTPWFMFDTLNLAQLRALSNIPEVAAELNFNGFVESTLRAMNPGPFVDLEHDHVAFDAYLSTVEEFVKGLSPAFNSLHFIVKHLRLRRHQLVTGTLADQRDAVLEYFRIPRQTPLMRPEYVKDADRTHVVRIGVYHVPGVPLKQPTAAEDAKLLESALLDLFTAGTATVDDFRPYVPLERLKAIHAAAMLYSGAPDAGQYIADVGGAAKLAAMTDEITVQLAEHNPKFFAPSDPVALHVRVKNVKKLVVKVFEVNTFAVFSETLHEINTDIKLDGMVPTEELVFEYDTVPLQRVLRTIELPSLSTTRRGVFVVELIGNGVSSRAIVRKGLLHYVEHRTVAGHIFRVLDEANQLAPPDRVSFLLGGRCFRPNDKGEIVVPFATPGGAGYHPVIMCLEEPDAAGAGAASGASGDGAGSPATWTFSTLSAMNHAQESYALSAGFMMCRESFIRDNRTAKVLVRPQLLLNNDIVCPLGALENVTLTLTSLDEDGNNAEKIVRDFAVNDAKESTVDVPVPYGLRSLSVRLEADIKILATNTKQHLSAGTTLSLNQIHATSSTYDLFFGQGADGYHVAVLGKTGEPIPNQKVNLSFQHQVVTNNPSAVLKTDDSGIVRLGALPHVTSVTVTVPGTPAREFFVSQDAAMVPPLHATTEGVQLRVPFKPQTSGTLTRMEVSLKSCGPDRTDYFDHLTVTPECFLEASGLPAGVYTLTSKIPRRMETMVTVVEEDAATTDVGKTVGYFIHGTNMLQRPPRVTPIQVLDATLAGDSVKVTLSGGHAATSRVHITATRFVPLSFDNDLGLLLPVLSSSTRLRPMSQYLTGRNLGDEHRYVLDRRGLKQYPGNNLPRPSLILNQRLVGATVTDVQVAAAAGAYDRMPTQAAQHKMKKRSSASHRSRRAPGGGGAGMVGPEYSSYDFLGAPAVMLANLPVEAGVVTVPAADLMPLGGAYVLTVVACDARHTASVTRAVQVATTSAPFRKLQLGAPLDLDSHIVQQRQVAAVQPGDHLDVAIASDTKTEEYDTFGKLFSLYATVSGNAALNDDFAFLPTWHTLSDAVKEKKYSQCACHEVNLFAYFKDRPFFDRVVAPFLACKRTMTFIDHYLLGHDLTPYLDMARFTTLNTAEVCLLASRVEGAAGLPATLAHRAEASPTPRTVFDKQFSQAIAGKGLEDDGERERMMMPQALAAPAPPAAVMMTGRAMAAMAPMPSSMRAANMSVQDFFDGDVDECKAEALCFDEDEEDDAMEHLLGLRADASRKQAMYQAMDKTQEYAEMQYYKVHAAGADLIPMNEFWADAARHLATAAPGTPFVSRHLLLPASGNLNTMLMALALIDLPLAHSGLPPAISVVDSALRFEATASPFVVFYKDMVSAPAPEQTTVLIGQNYFDPDDRFQMVKGSRVDKYVGNEFLKSKVYGCQVVVTNVSCARQNLDVLLQIPAGAIPVNRGFVTRSRALTLGPYSTEQIEYQFYFPELGTFQHYPAHVASEETLVACARPTTVHVVNRPSRVDTTSWEYVSQQASDDDVIAYLTEQNLALVTLRDICWRLQDASMYVRVVSVLRSRLVYDGEVWSYSLRHGDVAGMREYLALNRERLGFAHPAIESPLLQIVPEAHVGATADAIAGFSTGNGYEHREYDPLVNARVHQLGAKRQIMNRTVHDQYRKLLKQLCYVVAPTSNDLLAVTYHLLLQDRIDEAKDTFARVSGAAGAGVWSALQTKYMAAYLDFFSDAAPSAMAAAAEAAALRDYPVPKWANKFREVSRQLAEAAGVDAIGERAPVDPEDETREQRMAKHASADPTLSMEVENKVIKLSHSNLATATLRFYRMDIELLFSHNAFVSASSDSVGGFGFIRPNFTQVVQLGAGGAEPETSVPLPAEFATSNVMVEVVAGALRRSVAYYSNSLRVAVQESFGQLKVTSAETGRPLPRVYVKVYSRRSDQDDGQFYKDGYTDITGKFDYTSLNTDELSHVQRFALLVSSTEHGAVVREARPPKQ